MNRTCRYFLLLLLAMAVVSAHADSRRRKRKQRKPDTTIVKLRHPAALAPEADEALLAEVDTLPACDSLEQCLELLCRDSISQTAQLGVVVCDVETGQTLFSHNPRHRMRPASCQKLVTAIAALHYLGASHPVGTDLYVSGELSADSILFGDVYVVGRMDPLLAQGDVWRMATSLQQQGIRHIEGGLYADLSHRDSLSLGRGWCWDDPWGPLHALSVDGQNRFETEFMSNLNQLGISISATGMLPRCLPADARLVFHTRHTLEQMLPRMMKNSNNIYAESVFQQLASSTGQPWAGRKQGAELIGRLVAQETTASPQDYVVADGSGLSLYNYVTPRLLVELLHYAWRTPSIRHALLPTLPVAGCDGTLKKRMCGTEADGRVMAKTGTVEGVSSLAGYALTADGRTLAFSIICQGVSSSAQGKRFQDRICRLLCR